MVSSVADRDPPDPYHFPGSGSVSKVGPDPSSYQSIRIRIQQKPLKTEKELKKFRTKILFFIDLHNLLDYLKKSDDSEI